MGRFSKQTDPPFGGEQEIGTVSDELGIEFIHCSVCGTRPQVDARMTNGIPVLWWCIEYATGNPDMPLVRSLACCRTCARKVLE